MAKNPTSKFYRRLRNCALKKDRGKLWQKKPTSKIYRRLRNCALKKTEANHGKKTTDGCKEFITQRILSQIRLRIPPYSPPNQI